MGIGDRPQSQPKEDPLVRTAGRDRSVPGVGQTFVSTSDVPSVDDIWATTTTTQVPSSGASTTRPVTRRLYLTRGPSPRRRDEGTALNRRTG